MQSVRGRADRRMAKQFRTEFVSWRDADSPPWGLVANEADYARAAAQALEKRLGALADEGWIIDRIMPAFGLTPKLAAGYTVVAFK